jgi:hypothetical protein
VVLFIVTNFIFASIHLAELNVPAEPFIEGCRMTTVALVFLIPNGEMNSTKLQKVASHEFFGLEESFLMNSHQMEVLQNQQHSRNHCQSLPIQCSALESTNSQREFPIEYRPR